MSCLISCRLFPDEGILSSGLYSGTCKNCAHPLEFWSVPNPITEVKFTVNGTEYTVQNPDPHMSLNEWLRSQPGHQGSFGPNYTLCLFGARKFNTALGLKVV